MVIAFKNFEKLSEVQGRIYLGTQISSDVIDLYAIAREANV